MQEFEFIAPCHFGLESVLKQEITALGYRIRAVGMNHNAAELGGEQIEIV